MNNATLHTVGVDISKAHLGAFRLSTSGSARIANSATGFKGMATWIGDVWTWVVYKFGGSWHRGLGRRWASVTVSAQDRHARPPFRTIDRKGGPAGHD